MIDGPTYFAWFVMALLFAIVVWLIVMLGSLPKKIAAKRNHPQTDAINAASWIGLLLGGIGWPIAFVWAHLDAGPTGSATEKDDGGEQAAGLAQEMDQLKTRIAELERRVGQEKSGD